MSRRGRPRSSNRSRGDAGARHARRRARPSRRAAGSGAGRVLLACRVIGRRFACSRWPCSLAPCCSCLAPTRSDAVAPRNRFKPPVWEERGSWAASARHRPPGARHALAHRVGRARVAGGGRRHRARSSSAFGAAVGLVAGLLRRPRRRGADARAPTPRMSFPVILLALILAVTVGPSFTNVVIAIAVILWARYARVIRGAGADADAARLHRAGPHRRRGRLAHHHAAPPAQHARTRCVVLVTLQIGYVIIVEASLSFLGAGIPPPTPAWGSMIAEGRDVRDERVVGRRSSRASPSCSWCSPSTCSGTGCATRSTRSCASSERPAP